MAEYIVCFSIICGCVIFVVLVLEKVKFKSCRDKKESFLLLQKSFVILRTSPSYLHSVHVSGQEDDWLFSWHVQYVTHVNCWCFLALALSVRVKLWRHGWVLQTSNFIVLSLPDWVFVSFQTWIGFLGFWLLVTQFDVRRVCFVSHDRRNFYQDIAGMRMRLTKNIVSLTDDSRWGESELFNNSSHVRLR